MKIQARLIYDRLFDTVCINNKVYVSLEQIKPHIKTKMNKRGFFEIGD